MAGFAICCSICIAPAIALRSSNNANAGTFFLTDPVETRLIEDDHNGSDRIYVGHTVCGADTDTPGSKQWSFQWQAPNQDFGDINIYLSTIATNHNHSLNGDHTYTQIITLSANTIILGDLNGDSVINVLDVVQLVGIILENIDPEDSLWEGECFVFDHRVSVRHGLEEGTCEICFGCRWPLKEEELQSPKYEPGVCCPRCSDSLTAERRASLEERHRQVMLTRFNKKEHIGQKIERE